MTMPFLKRKEASAAGDDDSPIERRPDDGHENILDVIAGDLMDAIESKNKGLVIGALDALCEYIKDETQHYE